MSGQGFKRRSASDTLKRLTLHSKPTWIFSDVQLRVCSLYWHRISPKYTEGQLFYVNTHRHQNLFFVFGVKNYGFVLSKTCEVVQEIIRVTRPRFFLHCVPFFVTSTSGGVLHSEDISANQFLIDYRQVGDTKHDIIYMEVTHKSQWRKVYSDCIMEQNWHKIQAGYCHVDTIYWIPKYM